MKIELDIPEGQEASIFEQAILGVAGADLLKKEQPEAEVSAMYPVFQQIINGLGAAVPNEQRQAILTNVQKHIAEQTGQPIGTTQPEEPAAAAQQEEPKQEENESSNDKQQ